MAIIGFSYNLKGEVRKMVEEVIKEQNDQSTKSEVETAILNDIIENHSLNDIGIDIYTSIDSADGERKIVNCFSHVIPLSEVGNDAEVVSAITKAGNGYFPTDFDMAGLESIKNIAVNLAGLYGHLGFTVEKVIIDFINDDKEDSSDNGDICEE